MSMTAVTWYELLEEAGGVPERPTDQDPVTETMGIARASHELDAMRSAKQIRRGASGFLVLMGVLAVVAVSALLGAASGLA